MKKIIIAVFMSAIMFMSSGTAHAEKVMSAVLPGTASAASTSTSEHFISFYLTATNFPKNDNVTKYETSYRPAMEFESDILRKGDFSLIPGFYYTAIGIAKEKGEYTINPSVNLSLRYHILGGAMSVQAGYGTNGGGLSGTSYGAKADLYTFKNGVGFNAGVLFSNIGESVNSVFAGFTIPML